MKQKLNSIILFLILFIGQVNYVMADTTIASGTISGTSIKWTVTSPNGAQENLKLSVTGSGAIPSYQTVESPWEKYALKITEISLASTITQIGDGAFYGTAISSIEIPSSCTRIGNVAFMNSTNLKEIYIPSSVTYIGAQAFNNCSKLSLIHFDGRCTSSTGIAFYNVAAKGKFIEKEGTGSSYAKVPSGWDYYTHGEMRSGGAWVAESTDKTKLFFYSQKPNGRVEAQSTDYDSWRENCYKHTSLEINRNITSIGNNAFLGYGDSDVNKNGSINMQTITVEEGNTKYAVGEDGALYSLYNKQKTGLVLYPAASPATHVEVPSTVEEMANGAFYGAKNLKSVTFLGYINKFNQYVFAQASSLSFIYLATDQAPQKTYATSFTGVPSEGIVAAKADTEEFRTFTSKVGANWVFDGSSTSPTRAYISNGTLYVWGAGEYNIKSSNASWYSDRNSINKIVVGDGITNIGYSAFSGCTNVTEVTLNNKGSIDYYAFSGCTSLTRVNIGTGVTGFELENTTSVQVGPFYNCPKLATINISDFKSFNAIENLNYLTNGSYGTAEEKTLMVNGTTHPSTSELVIPEGITAIKNATIRYFKNVTKIRIPSTVTAITNSNFYGCKYLTEITLSSTVTSVGTYAFSYCTGLQTVTLNNTGTIGYHAFSGCTSLTRVNIGTGVTGFELVNTTSVQEGPFYNCPKLATINISDFKLFNAIENLNRLTNSSYGTAEEKTLMVNGTTHPSTSELVIPEGITEIKNVAIRYFKNVTKIKIPSTVTEITNENFINCKYLTEITLPSTVTSVGTYAFYGCTGLQTVTLNNTGSIGYNAFSGCTSLTRVNIGTGVTGFELLNTTSGQVGPFYNCPKLATINISDFKLFNALTDLKFLTNSKYGTAEEKTLMINGTTHSSTSELVIPEGMTEIKNEAIRYFKNVTKIRIPSTVTAITSSNFHDCNYLIKVILPASVTSVGSGAFSGCSALRRIVCNAITPPTATGSIATNPSEIQLKVTNNSSVSAYQTANYWKEFNIIGLQTSTEDRPMYVLETLDLKGLALEYGNPLSWSIEGNDETVATVDNNGVVTSKNFIYDGSTSLPYKTAKVIVNLEDGDTFICNVNVYPREVVLTDGNAYKNTVYYMPERITYTRTYAEKYANHLQCFYVPFDVEVTDELLEGFTFYELYMVSQKDANGNGEIEENEPLVMLLNKIPAGDVIQANMPYYIKPKAASTLTVTAENAKLYAAVNGTVSCSTTKNEYTLMGIYDKTNIKGHYTMAANGTFMHFSGDTNLGSYRWYMTVRNRRANGAEYENYARPIEILIEGEDDTTGIVALEDKASAPQNDKVYTLDGRQVTDIETLPSGIYIVNGKKVFKK